MEELNQRSDTRGDEGSMQIGFVKIEIIGGEKAIHEGSVGLHASLKLSETSSWVEYCAIVKMNETSFLGFAETSAIRFSELLCIYGEEARHLLHAFRCLARIELERIKMNHESS